MSRLLALTILLPALVGSVSAQKVKDLVGVERCKPGLVPPMVLDRIVDPEKNRYPGKPLVNLRLELHESVPAQVWLEKGKRETLFKIGAGRFMILRLTLIELGLVLLAGALLAAAAVAAAVGVIAGRWGL